MLKKLPKGFGKCVWMSWWIGGSGGARGNGGRGGFCWDIGIDGGGGGSGGSGNDDDDEVGLFLKFSVSET